MSEELVAIKDCESNPYRRLGPNPERREKVEQLKESVAQTGLWPRLMGRRKGAKVQICYGHHLLAALRELYPETYKIPVEVRQYADSDMLAIMCRENMAEWSSDALTLLCTMEATLDAYDDGVIELEPARGNSWLTANNKKFGKDKLAKFLGWIGKSGQPARKTDWTLHALELIREGELAHSDFAGLSDEQAYEMVAEIRRRKKAREFDAKQAEERAQAANEAAAKAQSDLEKNEALEYERREKTKAEEMRKYAKRETRAVANALSEGLREGSIGKRQIREKAQEVLPPDPFQPPKAVPEIRGVARSLAADIDKMLSPDDSRCQKIDELIQYRNHLDPISNELLARALEHLSQRTTRLAKALSQPLNNGQGYPVKSAGPKQIK
jgi:hypothetical protein